ncbi:hypothetical protein HY994_00115 [Candidatus Micrarchaeota archaeon]|nr:hypothetical protein [Candidatus Micrarchaeota archaeon]
MNPMFAAMISNRPTQCQKALAVYAENDDVQASEWLIVCPLRNKRDMQAAAKEINATIVAESEFLKELPKAQQLPFSPSFGGWRNMALAMAAKNKQSIVFLDDDTKPQNDVFRRHQGLLQDADLVIGKYAGHVGGSSSALLDLTHQLEKFEDGRITNEEFQYILQLRLSKIPPVQKPVENTGAVGGNLGIGFRLAQQQAFFPIQYRIEDGTYATLCSQKIVNPPVARSSIVIHEKQPVQNGLCDELAGDWKGNVLAAFVVASEKGQKPNVVDSTPVIRKGLLIDYFSEKYAKSKFRHPQLDRIASLTLELGQNEAQSAAALYCDVQQNWAASWEAVS